MDSVTDLTERLLTRLRELNTTDDHARGCQGREYHCSCDYDIRVDNAAFEAITALDSLTQENARLRSSRDGILEALDEAVKQYCEPMSMLNSHELGERLASDVAEIVRHARARKALGGGDE